MTPYTQTVFERWTLDAHTQTHVVVLCVDTWLTQNQLTLADTSLARAIAWYTTQYHKAMGVAMREGANLVAALVKTPYLHYAMPLRDDRDDRWPRKHNRWPTSK